MEGPNHFLDLKKRSKRTLPTLQILGPWRKRCLRGRATRKRTLTIYRSEWRNLNGSSLG